MTKLDEILAGLIDAEHGDLSAELAHYMLNLRFSDERVLQYESLVQKNQEGKLTSVEREELDAFVTANTFLMILKSKARRSLIERPSAA